MFPLYTSVPRRHFPIVNYFIIVLNLVIFLLLFFHPDVEQFIRRNAFVPAQFDPLNLIAYKQIFTALFLHGSILHIISNMMFLHVFGNVIEDKMGPLRYILFYLAAGFISTMSQYVVSVNNVIPMIGASGAVSAVAGAYFILFRSTKVKMLLVIVIFLTVVDLPAWFVLGYWFLAQAFSSIGALASVDLMTGGVAWFAHMGGFIFGNAIAYNLKKRSKIHT